MASFLRPLALIRRLYVLGTFLRSRLKSLLFVLYLKLIRWLTAVRVTTLVTTRRLGNSKDVVVSRRKQK